MILRFGEILLAGFDREKAMSTSRPVNVPARCTFQIRSGRGLLPSSLLFRLSSPWLSSGTLSPSILLSLWVITNWCCSGSYVFANFQLQLKPEADGVTASKAIPTFLALYCFGFIYELVLVYDALRMKNTIQIIGLCVCNIGLLIYGAVQVQQIKEAVNNVLVVNQVISPLVWPETEPFLIIIPCVVAMGTGLMLIVAWKLYDEFAWSIYKHISADLRMKRRYLTYQVRRSTLAGGSIALTLS